MEKIIRILLRGDCECAHKTKPNCNDFSAEDMQRWNFPFSETRINHDREKYIFQNINGKFF